MRRPSAQGGAPKKERWAVQSRNESWRDCAFWVTKRGCKRLWGGTALRSHPTSYAGTFPVRRLAFFACATTASQREAESCCDARHASELSTGLRESAAVSVGVVARYKRLRAVTVSCRIFNGDRHTVNLVAVLVIDDDDDLVTRVHVLRNRNSDLTSVLINRHTLTRSELGALRSSEVFRNRKRGTLRSLDLFVGRVALFVRLGEGRVRLVSHPAQRPCPRWPGCTRLSPWLPEQSMQKRRYHQRRALR